MTLNAVSKKGESGRCEWRVRASTHGRSGGQARSVLALLLFAMSHSKTTATAFPMRRLHGGATEVAGHGQLK